MTNIYILKLMNNKYYVGKTKYISHRMLDHFSNNGSTWTKKYKPIEILQIYRNCDELDEDKYTIKCMSKYGINNVRGGIYCRMNLNHNEKKIIQRSIFGMNNACYKCGSKDHFVNECNSFCTRCKRTSHNRENCYAKTFSNGKKILSYEELNESDSEISHIEYKRTCCIIF